MSQLLCFMEKTDKSIRWWLVLLILNEINIPCIGWENVIIKKEGVYLLEQRKNNH